jgi:hypothetical protein
VNGVDMEVGRGRAVYLSALPLDWESSAGAHFAALLLDVAPYFLRSEKESYQAGYGKLNIALRLGHLAYETLLEGQAVYRQ